jgi:hypothetical protein
LDIETKPVLAYTWGLFKQNISLDQIVDHGGVLCVGAKWLGKAATEFYSEWEHGHEEMIRKTYSLLSEADAVITYNGDRFDLPKLKGEFALLGLPAPPPIASIDVYKSVKKLGLVSGKLAFVGPFFAIGKKIKNAGFPLWTGVIDGDERCQRDMTKYCLQDVKLLEKVYDRLKAHIHNHPHLGDTGAHACGACGSTKVHSRGDRRTKMFKIQRLQCQGCGSWFDGKREKIT